MGGERPGQYANGKGDFALNELATGISRLGAAANRDITVDGDAQRPTLSSDFDVSLFPTDKLSIVNHTAVSNIRIDGDSFYSEFDFSTNALTILEFNFLGVRTVSNSTDLRYNVRKHFGVYAGYNFSDRQIRVEEAFNLPGVPNGSGSSLYPAGEHSEQCFGRYSLATVQSLYGKSGGRSGARERRSDSGERSEFPYSRGPIAISHQALPVVRKLPADI